MTLLIGNKEYTLEYTFEASLFGECTEKLTLLLTDFFTAENKEDAKKIIASISDIPSVALTIFHAGLLEHHSDEVKTKEDSKKLLAQYLREHKGEETGNFYGVLELAIAQMEEDGFFDLIGLTRMFALTETKNVKAPQDHKKKATKATEK